MEKGTLLFFLDDAVVLHIMTEIVGHVGVCQLFVSQETLLLCCEFCSACGVKLLFFFFFNLLHVCACLFSGAV